MICLLILLLKGLLMKVGLCDTSRTEPTIKVKLMESDSYNF